jgi:hypothetical protein
MGDIVKIKQKTAEMQHFLTNYYRIIDKHYENKGDNY